MQPGPVDERMYPTGHTGLSRVPHDAPDRAMELPAQTIDTAFEGNPDVASETLACTSKHPVPDDPEPAAPAYWPTGAPHRNVTTCVAPITLKAAAGDALTRQAVGNVLDVGVAVGEGAPCGVGVGVSIGVGVEVAVGIAVGVGVRVGGTGTLIQDVEFTLTCCRRDSRLNAGASDGCPVWPASTVAGRALTDDVCGVIQPARNRNKAARIVKTRP